jgi:hypothetical protein
MTQEDFIKVLKRKGYEYEIEGDKLVITEDGDVNLDALTSLPSGVEFRNRGDVWLNSLTSLSPGVEFKNGGDVWLNSLTSLPPGVVFRNGRNVYLNSLTSIPPGVEFKNGGAVWLKSLIRGGFQDWEGNIKGIESNRLLNLMIKKGIFEK